MQNELMIAILAGLGGMLGWGLADLFAKKTIDEIGDVVTLAWAHIFGTLALFCVALYEVLLNGREINIPHDSQNWFFLLFFGVLQAVVYLLVYQGFGKGKVAILNPIFASFSGLTALFSIFIFGEIVSGGLIVSLVVLFIGVILISMDLSAFRERRIGLFKVPGFKEVGFATLLAACWTLGWDKFVSGQDWMIYALFMYFFMTMVIIIVAKHRNINLFFIKPGAWKYLILIGLCETLAYLSISYGYSLTSKTSVIALLSGAFSLPTIILARAFLKEKITPLQTFGSVVIIAGIVLLSLL